MGGINSKNSLQKHNGKTICSSEARIWNLETDFDHVPSSAQVIGKSLSEEGQ